MREKKAEKNKKDKSAGSRILRIVLAVLLVICLLGVVLVVVNSAFGLSLWKYIDSFEPVDYSSEDRVIPEMGDNGYYSFSSDGDTKVMFITDIHLGGSFGSKKADRKSIYEVISMVQAEKPDLVILGGDNTFAVPAPVFNGGNTLNNKMAARIVMHIFDHEGVYYTTVFGNHDAESIDFYGRSKLGAIYESNKSEYCLFHSDFSDPENKMPSVTNQIITLSKADGSIKKILLMMDSNSYNSNSIKASIDFDYDTIHQAQVDWAEEEIEKLSRDEGLGIGEHIKVLSFLHIPVGEYQIAYEDLRANDFKDTKDSKYLCGVWDEQVSDKLGIRVWFGGCSDYKDAPDKADSFFETLGPEGIDCLDGIMCGHDHVNTAGVEYKGIPLLYGYSVDNTAYDDIAESGLQRGCTVITVHDDGSWDVEYKNAYQDLGVEQNKYVNVYLDHYLYDGAEPSGR